MTMHSDFLANLMLLLIALSLLAAIVAVVWSSAVAARHREKLAADVSPSSAQRDTIASKTLEAPSATVRKAVFLSTAILLLLSFLLASTRPLSINGNLFESAFWLRVTGMFIVSSAVLLLAAIAVYAYAELKQRIAADQPVDFVET